ncbi:hypothetical protein PHPALM_27860 [Phytophthora palmivora]|uniref:Reverse transcriptase Ty1/copia-type domain-containing protein n=1 Tax=Phytophthora palmivora TaxID=4796 RepID=A0A2P4XBK6_9STRA|nr:hypothetical protein PHPALM_27860 [Phytophthora palmivora]
MVWRRERHVTRSITHQTANNADESAQQDETPADVVNRVVEVDPKNYSGAMHSQLSEQLLKAMDEELSALDENGVWDIVQTPREAHVLHTKPKRMRQGTSNAERRSSCRAEMNKDYNITFAEVADMFSVKLIGGLARKWRVPAKHGVVPNAYVKADKEAELVVYIHLLKEMTISEDTKKKLGVASDDNLVLEVLKALYGLKQTGRLWSKLLQKTMLALGFEQSLTDMSVCYRWRLGVLLVVGVYVDDLLVNT